MILDQEGMDAKLYGNTAVLRATAQIATSQKGGAPSPAHLRFIHLWVYPLWALAAGGPSVAATAEVTIGARIRSLRCRRRAPLTMLEPQRVEE